jgi:hypothetical protein
MLSHLYEKCKGSAAQILQPVGHCQALLHNEDIRMFIGASIGLVLKSKTGMRIHAAEPTSFSVRTLKDGPFCTAYSVCDEIQMLYMKERGQSTKNY